MDVLRPIREMVLRLRRRESRRRALREFRRSLMLIVEPSALVASVAHRLKELFDPDRLILCELDPRQQRFDVSFATGVDERDLGEDPPQAQGRLAKWLKINETCLHMHRQGDVVAYLSAAEQRWLERSRCQICVPMVAKNQLIGLVLMGFDHQPSFARRDLDLLMEIADQASLAFQNAALYREQQERLARLHRADRLASMGQLAAGVAHEVRNPLTAIRSTMQYIGSSLHLEQRQMVDELIEEVDRIDHIISGLLNLSSSGGLERERMDLSSIVEQTLRLMEVRAREQQVELEEKLGGSLPVEIDAGQIRQVVLNVVLNALQALAEAPGEGGGTITLETRRLVEGFDPASGWARLDVSDTGPGIEPEVLDQVLDPFFTTKSEGTGLGLSICHNLVEQHGGKLEIESTPGAGTRVTILLPLAAETPARSEAQQSFLAERAPRSSRSPHGADSDRRR